jgi:hypothetical protein
VTFVALARADVTRVVVTTAGNRRIALSFHNAPFGTRAVGYAVARRLDVRPPRRNDFARSLTAYSGHRPLTTLGIGGCFCPPKPVPTLTVPEQNRAVALATSHPEVRALVGDRPLRVVPDASGGLAGAWYTYGRRLKIGAAVELAWDERLAVDGSRRTIAYDYTELSVPTYREGVVRLRSDSLLRLTVLIDLVRNKVVGLEPGPRGGG